MSGIRMAGGCGCGGGAGDPAESGSDERLVYVVGTVHPRPQSVGVEQELKALLGLGASVELEESHLRKIAADASMRAMARHLDWMFHVGGIPAYQLIPTDPALRDIMRDSFAAGDAPGRLLVVIGVNPSATSSDDSSSRTEPASVMVLYCNPFVRSEAAGGATPAANDGASELFFRLTDHPGARPHERAGAFLATRTNAIASILAQGNGGGVQVAARMLPFGNGRDLVELEFSGRHSDIPTLRFTVDVTEAFPFLVDRGQG